MEYVTKSEASEFFKEVKDLFAQTEHLLKERSLETERLLKEKSLETDKKFQDTDKKFQDTDNRFKSLQVMIGQLGGRLGAFVEEMVRPAAVRLFRERGYDVRQVVRDVSAYDDAGQFVMEIDLLVLNTDTAIAIECKSHCSVEDVKEHLEQLSGFKACFPQYADFRVFGAMASMVMPEETSRYAYRRGLYVLAQSGDTIRIRNDDKFRPVQW